MFWGEMINSDLKNKINFYLHAGESQFSENENVVEALLLKSKWIGHGFNIALHPYLVDLAIEQDVCLEICPISNYLLGYTLDLRNHPAWFLIN